MPEKYYIITIDGPSGAGKSTISRMLAERLGCTFLDTGAMYRAVGLKCQRAGLTENDTEQLATLLDATDLRLMANGGDTKVVLDGEDVSTAIRTAEMGLIASRFSSLPLVRQKLTELQRRIGEHGSLVAEGRDMGTVVFPNAPFKFYLDASAEERARRRTEQLHIQGQSADYAAILAQIVKRDHDDSTRALAPLKPATDAIIIDSSVMSITEVLARMEDVVKRGNSSRDSK